MYTEFGDTGFQGRLEQIQQEQSKQTIPRKAWNYYTKPCLNPVEWLKSCFPIATWLPNYARWTKNKRICIVFYLEYKTANHLAYLTDLTDSKTGEQVSLCSKLIKDLIPGFYSALKIRDLTPGFKS